MTALVMTSEVDLAIERILSDRNAPSSTSAEIDSDVTNTSEEGLIGHNLTTVFGKAVALHSPATKMESESIMDYKEPVESRRVIEDAGKRSGNGGSQEKESKEKAAEIAKAVFDNLIDDAVLSLVFDAHRAAKTGLFFLYDSTDAEDDEEYGQVNDERCCVDVFGQALISTAKTSKALAQLECVCPQCHQSRLACRFAPHLEKCMGMGRNSSRLASRRLAASAAAANAANAASSRGHDSGAMFNGRESSDDGEGDDDQYVPDDDDEDDDWTLGGGGSGSGGGAFGKKRAQRKRGPGVGAVGRSPRKRGGGVRMSPKKPTGLRSSGGSSGALIGDLLLNESPKSDGMKKMRKTSSYSKFPVGQQQYDFGMETGVNDFLSMGDSYDPPSPSF